MMKNSTPLGVLIAAFGMACTAAPLFAAEPQPWPWKSKLPPDPALVSLTSVEDVTATINKSNPPTLTITVNASAPTPDFSELQLAPRMGDPNDLIFAFDAKGRPSQDQTNQVTTPVNFTVEYTDAPIDKVGVVEINAQNNCKAFSLTENKAVDCTSQSTPQ
jgi:hypothetical protein